MSRTMAVIPSDQIVKDRLKERDAVVDEVRRQYEMYPYPSYPLWFRPRVQEAWLGSSAFSQSLSRQITGRHFPDRCPAERILLGGCGTIQPFLLAAWEHPSSRFCFVDLSRSSLLRARIRLFLAGFRHEWYVADLCHFLSEESSPSFFHADLYGVLHHMENPEECLHLLSTRMSDGATLRTMIYNVPARQKIHLVQDLFRLLELHADRKEDLRIARKILWELKQSSQLRELLPSTGPFLKEDPVLVDTFLHARETRESPAVWFARLQRNAFYPFALYDRYGELDDLNNPLWSCPSAETLFPSCRNRYFENNLELFCLKGEGEIRSSLSAPSSFVSATANPLLRLMPPPLFWFRYQETRRIPERLRWMIWHSFLGGLRGRSVSRSWQKKLFRLPEESLKRLARLGALLPGAFAGDSGFVHMLMEPLCSWKSAPDADLTLSESAFLSRYLKELCRIRFGRDDLYKKKLHSISKTTEALGLRF